MGCVAAWGDKRCLRYWTSRAELLDFFFGPGAPMLPRPADWFCGTCLSRNAKAVFFCTACKNKTRRHSYEGLRGVATVVDPDSIRVADHGYPREGDWGCGLCGTAMFGRDRRCSQCGSSWDDPRHVIVSQ